MPFSLPSPLRLELIWNLTVSTATCGLPARLSGYGRPAHRIRLTSETNDRGSTNTKSETLEHAGICWHMQSIPPWNNTEPGCHKCIVLPRSENHQLWPRHDILAGPGLQISPAGFMQLFLPHPQRYDSFLW